MIESEYLTPTGELADRRRVIRLPRATRLLAAWLVCAAIAIAVVWFSPLGIEHRSSESCWRPLSIGYSIGDPCPMEYRVTNPAERFSLPILVLRGAALGTPFWVAYLGVRAVLSRVRFTVG